MSLWILIFLKSGASKRTCSFQLHYDSDFKAFSEEVEHVRIYKVSKVKNEFFLSALTVLRTGFPFL